MSERTMVQNGADLIAAERRRQIEAEGWTEAHDDGHSGGELAMAAACYALPNREMREERVAYVETSENGGRDVLWWVPKLWPWNRRWWKPTPADRIRELAKAGALIAAEIDRLRRAALTPTSPAPSPEH